MIPLIGSVPPFVSTLFSTMSFNSRRGCGSKQVDAKGVGFRLWICPSIYLDVVDGKLIWIKALAFR